MNNRPDQASEPSTGPHGPKARLIEAAGRVFADHGFEGGTIREIARRARVNLNAVNYYFGSKRRLYLAVFSHIHRQSLAADAAERLPLQQLDPEEQLRTIVRRLLRAMMAQREVDWRSRLISRELREPSGMLPTLVRQFVRPRAEVLVAVVRTLAPGLADPNAQLCAESIVGQCAHFGHTRAIVQQLIPGLARGPEGFDEIADHVVRFSLAALGAIPMARSVLPRGGTPVPPSPDTDVNP